MDEERKYVEYARQLAQGLCKGIVEVERRIDERGILLLIKAEKADIPVLIGKGGNTITAIRTLINAAGRIEGEKVSVKVPDPNGTSF